MMMMMSVTNNMLLVQGPHSRFNLLSSTTDIANIFPFSHSQSRTRSNRLFVDCNASRKAGIYTKTTPDRKLKTPHSGYHFDGSTRRFFEGWYFKVSLPEQRESFCFMYSDEDPAFSQNLGCGQEILNGQRFPGIGAQILGPEDKYICQYSNEVQNFWGSEHDLALGNTFLQRKGSLPPMEETYPQEFQTRVEEGFQVTPTWHQGFIRDDGRSNYTSTVKTARWEYSTKPVYGWGDVNSRQKATAGWLAAFPIFEPHWQICMAGGLSTGWIEWDNQLFEFENAPSYSEKNWGGSFPEKWFWVQCNVFEGAHGEVALTAGGGKRLLLSTYEDVAMIGIHYDGKFYEFVPWRGFVQWKILPWGSWQMKAQNNLYEVELVATTKSTGTILRAPSKNAGLAPLCKDTCHGDLNLKIWEHPEHGERGKVILDVTSDMAALEIGGRPWYECYEKKSISPPLLKELVGLPLEMEEISKHCWNVGTNMTINATCKPALSQGTHKVNFHGACFDLATTLKTMLSTYSFFNSYFSPHVTPYPIM